MKRGYSEWICAAITILGVAGENRVLGQATEQAPPPASSPTPEAASGRPGIPSPGEYRLPGKTSKAAPGEAVPEGVSPLGVPPGGAGAAPGGELPESAGPAGAVPEVAAPTAASALAAEAALAGLAGEVGAGALADMPPAMIGDQSPYSFVRAFQVPPIPTPFPPPRPGVGPGTRTAKSIAGVVPAIRGFKIADNQTPRPTDRVFSSFNYFDNVNRSLNERLGAPIQNMIVYRQVYGFEKTFFDQWASIGIRQPIDTLNIQSSRQFPGLGGTSSAFGNLNVFTKFIVWQDKTGSLISAGLAIDIPSGPNSFAGFPTILGKNVTDIQPYLGYIFTNGGDWFVQGFSSIAVPTDAALPTMIFVDAAMGYYVYRNNTPGSFLTAVVPTIRDTPQYPVEPQLVELQRHLWDPNRGRSDLRSEYRVLQAECPDARLRPPGHRTGSLQRRVHLAVQLAVRRWASGSPDQHDPACNWRLSRFKTRDRAVGPGNPKSSLCGNSGWRRRPTPGCVPHCFSPRPVTAQLCRDQAAIALLPGPLSSGSRPALGLEKWPMSKRPRVFARAANFLGCPLGRWRIAWNERRPGRALAQTLTSVGHDRVDVRSRVDIDPQIIGIAVEQAGARGSRCSPTQSIVLDQVSTSPETEDLDSDLAVARDHVAITCRWPANDVAGSVIDEDSVRSVGDPGGTRFVGADVKDTPVSRALFRGRRDVSEFEIGKHSIEILSDRDPGGTPEPQPQPRSRSRQKHRRTVCRK